MECKWDLTQHLRIGLSVILHSTEGSPPMCVFIYLFIFFSLIPTLYKELKADGIDFSNNSSKVGFISHHCIRSIHPTNNRFEYM